MWSKFLNNYMIAPGIAGGVHNYIIRSSDKGGSTFMFTACSILFHTRWYFVVVFVIHHNIGRGSLACTAWLFGRKCEWVFKDFVQAVSSQIILLACHENSVIDLLIIGPLCAPGY